jgi:hypothetical protein
MPANHGDQKRREKRKRKADAAKREPQRRPSIFELSPAAILRHAAELPMGPSFISADWQVIAGPPRLVMVVLTRRSPAEIVVPMVVLVDRTCLGVKNAMVAKPTAERDLPSFVERVGAAHEDGMQACDLLVAQSVVFHAIDYAHSLGFAPHRDFSGALLGPRPAVLLDTPLSRPERPFYMSGPRDPVAAVLAQLERHVGAGNFHFTVGGPGGMEPAGDDDGDAA